MRKTLFAGLTALDADESLASDGGAFTNRDRDIIDHFLEIGARSHRHDAHVALASPTTPPVVTVNASGGTLPADTSMIVCYTRLDDQGGETVPSPFVTVTTAPPIAPPSVGASATLSNAAGTLVADTYYYVFTLLDAAGGETTQSYPLTVVRTPGPANAQVILTGLAVMLANSPGATKYRIYRAKGQQAYDLLNEGTAASFTDNGSTLLDCGNHPPSLNTTNSTNTVNVVVGSGSGAIGPATLWRLYISIDGDFTTPSLYGSTGRLPAEAGTIIAIPVFLVDDGAPPDVSTAVSGATAILAGDLVGLETPWINVGSGGASPVFANGWANLAVASGYAPMRFRLELDTVHIDGVAGSGTVDTAVFQLPDGYRPTYLKTAIRRGFTGAGSGVVDAYVEVNTAGMVLSRHHTNFRAHFDEISFRID